MQAGGITNKGTGNWGVNSIAPLHVGFSHIFLFTCNVHISIKHKIHLGKISSVETFGTATLVREAEQTKVLSHGEDHKLQKKRRQVSTRSYNKKLIRGLKKEIIPFSTTQNSSCARSART